MPPPLYFALISLAMELSKKGSSNMVLSLSLGIRSVGMRPYRALGSVCIVSVVAPIVMVTGYFMKALEANK